jgi:hypothetical protein
MPVALAEVSNPNGPQVWGSEPPYKTHLMDVTFDNSYPTTGEIVTATQVSLSQIVDVQVVRQPTNAAGTLALIATCEPNASGSQAVIQLYRYDGAAAGKASLEEAANAFDASLFTGRFKFIGY